MVRFPARIRSMAFLLAFLLTGASGLSKAQSLPNDVYTNLLGNWVGYDDTVLDGVVKHIPVELMITRKKDSVQMDYTYSKPGQPDFSTATKFMQLNPAHSEMTLRWKGSKGSDKYNSKDLSKFARTGLGTFAATGPAVGPGGGNGMFVFYLDQKALSYKWMTETAHGQYTTATSFSFHRADPQSQSIEIAKGRGFRRVLCHRVSEGDHGRATSRKVVVNGNYRGGRG